MTTPSTSLNPEQLQKLLNGPAGTPPVGVMPNLNDPPNLDTYVILTISICMTLATIAVLLRMYTKILITRSLAYEDCKWLYLISVMILILLDVIVLALVSTGPSLRVECNWPQQLLQIGYTIPSALVSKFGGGTHIWNVRLHDYFSMLYVSYHLENETQSWT